MLTHIKIKKLFGVFDYDIELKDGGITILTGPNGYGKTTILKMLHAISISNFLFLVNLHFEKMELTFNDFNYPIGVIKKNDAIVILQHNKEDIFLSSHCISQLMKETLKNSRPPTDDKGHFVNFYKDNPLEIKNEIIFEKYHWLFNHTNDKLNIFSQYMPFAYFIKEQRLLNLKLDNIKTLDTFEVSIKKYAEHLKTEINKAIKSYSSASQRLDNSFPKRLFEENYDISEQDFIIRFNKIKVTQKLLNHYGIFNFTEDNEPTYKKENAKALFIYLNDTEEKLNVFSNILEKLGVFTEIINKKQLSNKTIKIDKYKGFFFITNDDSELPLTFLSSGEQHETIVLYQLLFKVKENSLILIDEPETGLHVSWQQEFIKDLKRIIELQNFTAIVATHSPDIIDNNWDLIVDLYELSASKEDALECQR